MKFAGDEDAAGVELVCQYNTSVTDHIFLDEPVGCDLANIEGAAFISVCKKGDECPKYGETTLVSKKLMDK